MASSSSSDWDKAKTMFTHLSDAHLRSIWNQIPAPFNFSYFCYLADSANQKIERKKLYGNTGLMVSSLFQMLNINVYRKRKRKEVSFYGKIYNKEGIHYESTSENLENFGVDGGLLNLTASLDCSTLFLNSNDVFINLRGDQHQKLIKKIVCLKYSTNLFEEVKREMISQNGVVCEISYLAIPMAVSCQLDFKIFSTQNLENIFKSIHVFGEVIAKYKNTFGTYHGEEIILFKKDKNESENILLNCSKSNLLKNKCYIAVPSYSILEIVIKLYNKETERALLIERAELDVSSFGSSAKRYPVGDFIFRLTALWQSPHPRSSLIQDDGLPSQGMQTEAANWSLLPHKEIHIPVAAVQLFAVIFCSKEVKEGNVLGGIYFDTDEDSGSSSVLGRWGSESKPYILMDNKISLPFEGGNQPLPEYSGFKISCDLEVANSRLKGFFGMSSDNAWSKHFQDHLLCSLIKGEKGFLSIYYTILSEALQVKVWVKYTTKMMEESSFVSGLIYAKYDGFNSSTPIYENCFGIELFKSKEDEYVPIINGLVPLSRSQFLVPSNSRIILHFSVEFGDNCFINEELILSPTADSDVLENDHSILHARVEWSSIC